MILATEVSFLSEKEASLLTAFLYQADSVLSGCPANGLMSRIFS